MTDPAAVIARLRTNLATEEEIDALLDIAGAAWELTDGAPKFEGESQWNDLVAALARLGETGAGE